jgi:aryl-alcohol dehydrogenase-like predicted oxidoreductase
MTNTPPATPLHHRPLGRTGLSVAEIGFGAWGIGGGWGERDDAAALRALHSALDHGIDLIDTAMGYGDGHSEQLIGQVLAERGASEVVVATKASPQNRRWPAAADTPLDQAYPPGYLTECTEASLRRLGTERIAVQQLHVWAARWLHEGGLAEEVDRLRADGKIAAFGISVNDHEPATAVEVVRSGLVDTIQVIHNVFDQSPQDELYDACAEHDVGVIVRVALDEGGLTGTVTADTTFPEGDWRQQYFRGDRPRQVQQRTDAIVADLGITTDQLAETALRYVLSFPVVSSVIVGMRSERNVLRNVALADGRGLPAEQVAKLAGHRWDRNFYAAD